MISKLLVMIKSVVLLKSIRTGMIKLNNANSKLRSLRNNNKNWYKPSLKRLLVIMMLWHLKRLLS
nr:MAG TPA: hypothetical protein [Caudoviricetes sp.]